MPITNIKDEREIVVKGRQQGKSDDFIKQAVTRYRQLNTKAPEPTGVSGPAGFALGAIKSFVGGARDIAGTLQAGGQAALATITPGKSYQDIKSETGLESLKDETAVGGQIKEQLTPQGKAEKAGGITEKVAEFVLPVAASLKIFTGAKAVAATESLTKMFVNAATGRTGKALQQDVIKETPRILKEGQQLLPTYAQRFLDFGKWFATPQQGLKASQEVLTQTAEEFNKLATSEVGKRAVQFGDLLPTIQGYVKKLAQVIPDSPEKTALMKKLGTSIRPTLTWGEGLDLKRAINGLLPKSSFFQDAKLSATNKSLQRSVVELSDRLEKVAADTNFSKLNNAWNLFSDTYSQLVKKIAPNTSLTAGGALEKTLGALLSPAKAVLGAVSTPAEMGAARALNLVSKFQSGVGKVVGKFPGFFK
jgi:hypothetical protein